MIIAVDLECCDDGVWQVPVDDCLVTALSRPGSALTCLDLCSVAAMRATPDQTAVKVQ